MSTWNEITIDGRPASVFVPAGPPRFGLLFLPDYNSRAPTASRGFEQMLARHHIACVAPHADKTFWTDRPHAEFHAQLTAERYLVDRVLPYFAQQWSLVERSVGLMGFGIGGQGALRQAFRHALRFPVVAAIAPSVEFQEWYYGDTPLMDLYPSKEYCRQDTALLNIHPTEFPPHIYFCMDPDDVEWVRGADRLHEKLQALGISHVADLSTRAGGHSERYFEQMTAPAVEFLIQGLERESRRLM